MLRKVVVISIALVISMGWFGLQAMRSTHALQGGPAPKSTPKPTPTPMSKADAELVKAVIAQLGTAFTQDSSKAKERYFFDTTGKIKLHITSKNGVVKLEGAAAAVSGGPADESAKKKVIAEVRKVKGVKSVRASALAVVAGPSCDPPKQMCNGICQDDPCDG
ncbi:MAG: BON domain-containing protein [Acidobacteria bacterium]|nr:BON domain-containing protein [Acidobacteriota bacterium]